MASREGQSVFWDDLAEDLEEPTFRETYIETSAAIAAIDKAAAATAYVRERADEQRSQ